MGRLAGEAEDISLAGEAGRETGLALGLVKVVFGWAGRLARSPVKPIAGEAAETSSRGGVEALLTGSSAAHTTVG